MFEPDTDFEKIAAARKEVARQVERTKLLIEKNEYDGPYTTLFSLFSSDIEEIILAVRKEVEDGFQFRDLGPILARSAKPIQRIIKSIETIGYREDREKVVTDLVLFVYYEIKVAADLSGFVNWITKLVLELFLARGIATWLLKAFDYTNGRVQDIGNKVPDWVKDFLKNIR